MMATKTFISYSWSSPEHEEWVLRLATDLRNSGVDAILDKWDLKEGHEANAFMEQMVSDPAIEKVIIISDRTYVEKSNSRTGGAGTEAQIISREIFEKRDQDKFVVVATELDEYGHPVRPTYYTSRIFIDFSDTSRFSDSFEQLLRWIADKPIYKKPELGKLPAYITDEDSAITLSTGAASRRAMDALTNSKSHAYPATKEYFELFTRELEKFRFEPEFDSLSDDIIANIDSFIPYRNEFIEVIKITCNYTNDEKYAEIIHAFFERFLSYFGPPEGMKQYSDHSFDNFKFFAHELFLYSCTVFCQRKTIRNF